MWPLAYLKTGFNAAMEQTAIVCGSLYFDTNLFPDYCLQAMNISAAINILSGLGTLILMGLVAISF